MVLCVLGILSCFFRYLYSGFVWFYNIGFLDVFFGVLIKDIKVPFGGIFFSRVFKQILV